MEEKKLLKREYTVADGDLAVNMGSGSLRVLATPAIAAWAENTAMKLADMYTDSGATTVGTMITLEHISASPVNAVISVEAELVSIEGRKYGFDIRAYDAKGLIAHGKHTRFAVYADRFQQKTDEKFTGEYNDRT